MDGRIRSQLVSSRRKTEGFRWSSFLIDRLLDAVSVLLILTPVPQIYFFALLRHRCFNAVDLLRGRGRAQRDRRKHSRVLVQIFHLEKLEDLLLGQISQLRDHAHIIAQQPHERLSTTALLEIFVLDELQQLLAEQLYQYRLYLHRIIDEQPHREGISGEYLPPGRVGLASP